MVGLQPIEKQFRIGDAEGFAPGVEVAGTSAKLDTGRVKLTILLPFTTLLVFVVGLFLITTYLAEKRATTTELLESAQAAQRLFQNEMEEDASMMHGTLDAIILNRELKAAFIAGNRDRLLRQVGPLFENLRDDHGISHFYFTSPDRKAFLRVHRPDLYGDAIDRATTLRAERTGKIAYGIELGTLGTLTLRAVIPWHDNGRLIGYVELGHDVGHFVEEVRDILGVNVVVMVYKTFIDRYSWEAGKASRLRQWPWSRLRTTVSVARTMEEVPAGLMPFLEQGRHPYQFMLPLEGGGKQAHVAFVPLRDAGNQEIGDLVIIRDVTEERAAFASSMMLTAAASILAGGAVFFLFLTTLRRVEADYHHKREVEAKFSRLSREHERIVQVEKLSAIGMMIGEIAHQINNPLVGVVNMSQLALREAHDPERIRKLLENILGAGKHCRDFVKRMVEFTKISRSEFQRTELRKLIGDTIVLFRQSASNHPRVATDYPDLPVILEIDPVMIRHALFNLLTNAAQADAAANGDGAITVRLFPRVGGKDHAPGWCIAVEDRGPGLSEEIQERMFMPFFTTRAEGTGLGLPVVQYVVNLHGGHISGANNPGGGAYFTMWLPEQRPRDDQES